MLMNSPSDRVWMYATENQEAKMEILAYTLTLAFSARDGVQRDYVEAQRVRIWLFRVWWRNIFNLSPITKTRPFPTVYIKRSTVLRLNNWEPLMSYQAPGPGSNPGWLMRRVKG